MIRELIESLKKNSFFSGGLMLMAIGSAAAFARRLPGQIGRFVERRISIWVEIPDRDPAFGWVQAWLAARPYAKRARDLSLSTTWVSAEPDPKVDTNQEMARHEPGKV
jgi:chaperone BCS1